MPPADRPQAPWDTSPWPEERPFALCLSHDVDRVRKSYQYVTHLRKPGALRRALRLPKNPYWNFERILEMEKGFDVKSTFFFLQESKKLNLRAPREWGLSLGRYRFHDPEVARAIRMIDSAGWEVGLHGSFESFRDFARLSGEKHDLESVLGHPVAGVRQHYLNLEIPRTWQIQKQAGLSYDASLGLKAGVGYDGIPLFPFEPFQDEFVVLPLAVMDGALFSTVSDTSAQLTALTRIVEQAEAKHALLAVLWHQRFLNPAEFPNENSVYESFLRLALEREPWVATSAQVADWWRTHVGGKGH